MDKKKKIIKLDCLFKSPISTSYLVAFTSLSLFTSAFAEEISSSLLTSFDELFQTNETLETKQDGELELHFSPDKENVNAIEPETAKANLPDLSSIKHFPTSWFGLKNFSAALLQMKDDSKEFAKVSSPQDRKIESSLLQETSFYARSVKQDHKLSKSLVTPLQEALAFQSDNSIAELTVELQPYNYSQSNVLKTLDSNFEILFVSFKKHQDSGFHIERKTHLYFPELFEELLQEKTSYVAKDHSVDHNVTRSPNDVSLDNFFAFDSSNVNIIAVHSETSPYIAELSSGNSFVALSPTESLGTINLSTPFRKHQSNLDDSMEEILVDFIAKSFEDESYKVSVHAELEPLSSSSSIDTPIHLIPQKEFSTKDVSFIAAHTDIQLSKEQRIKPLQKLKLEKGGISRPLTDDLETIVFLSNKALKAESTYDPSQCVAAYPTQQQDLFLQFFTKTKDTTQVDLNTFLDETFYISQKSYLSHTFHPKESILIQKPSHSIVENPLAFALSTFEEMNDLYIPSGNSSYDMEVALNPEPLAIAFEDSFSDLSKELLTPTYILNTNFSYIPEDSIIVFEQEIDLPSLNLKKFDPSYNTAKPTTIYTHNNCFASTVFEQSFSYESNDSEDVSIIGKILEPLKESSKKFLALQKVFSPNLGKYNVLLTIPSNHSSKAPVSLVNIARVRSPKLVENKIKLLPTRFVSGTLNKAVRNTNENLAAMPSLSELNTTTLSEEFTTDVQITPYRKGKGYLFAVTIEPISKKLFSRAPHNFLFLVDKSGSIQKPRFDIFKAAVSKSLKYLQEGDTFNIMTFDSKLTRFSKDSVYYSASSKHAAKHFIESQPRSNKYALPNLYKLLIQAHEISKKSNLPTSVILLTNGKTLEDFSTNNDLLSYLVNANNDDFTLYANCASHNNNQVMLEILSTLNKGELMHSQTFAAFPRKVATVVKHAGNLLAHSIHVSTTKSSSHVEFFPDSKLSRNLFSDKPYTIIGYAEKLCDFELILQGRLGQDWLNLKKEISLKEAVQDGKTLHKELAMYQAYDKYYEFLKHGNTAFLDEAEKLLKPYNARSFY